MKKLRFMKALLLMCLLMVGIGNAWGETYQHVFNVKPSTGNSVNLSGVTWKIEAEVLGSYNSVNYAGVQIGTSKNAGSITLTSTENWNYQNNTKITEVRLWLNTGGSEVTSSVTIGGKVAISDGTAVVKNSNAGVDWTKATKVTFTPATDGNSGIIVIKVDTQLAGYICAMEIDCENGGSAPEPVLLPAPSNLSSSNVTTNSATLSWDEVENASGYKVKIGDTVSESETNSYSTTGLTPNTEYTWAVMSVGDGINYTSSDYAGNATFTTQQEQGGDDTPTGNVIFYESFDSNEGTGGNDDRWNDNIASATIKFDNDGWEHEKGSGAYKCAKFGTGSVLGTATTPALRYSGNAMLTFKAAAWNATNENTTLNLSVIDGGGIGEETVNLKKGEWTTYTIVLNNLTDNSKIKFEGKTTSNSRFFLDEVYVIGEPAKKPTSLTVSGTPAKVTYFIGESFDVKGLAVTATYDDESPEDVTDKVEWSLNPASFMSLSENISVTATATYEGLTAQYEGTVSVQKKNPEISVGNILLTVGKEEGISAVTEPEDVSLTYTILSGGEHITLSDGVVKGMSVGTATVKASYDGNDIYNVGETTFTVTVVEAPTATIHLYNIDEIQTANAEKMEWVVSGVVTMTADKAESGTSANNYYPGVEGQNCTSTRFYKGSKLTFTPAKGIIFSSIVFEATKLDYVTALVNSTWANATVNANDKTVTITPVDGKQPVVATIGGTTGGITVTVTYSQETKHTAQFSINGTIDPENNFQAYEGDPITFPSNPTVDDEEFGFVGWTTTEINGTQSAKLDLVVPAEEKMGAADVVYYAVFGRLDNSAFQYELVNTLTNDETYVFVSSNAVGEAIVLNTDRLTQTTSGTVEGTNVSIIEYDTKKIISTIDLAWEFFFDGENFKIVNSASNEYLKIDGSGFSRQISSYKAFWDDDRGLYGTSGKGTKYYVYKNSNNFAIDNNASSRVYAYKKTLNDNAFLDYCTTVLSRVLESISVKTNPSKTEYKEGEKLDLAGLVLTAHYDNEEVEDVTTGYTTDPSNGTILNTLGENTVTITYKEKTCSLTVTVIEIPSHEVTFFVNGTTTKNTFKEGVNINFPSVSSIGEYSFEGWITEAIEGRQNNAPDEYVDVDNEIMGIGNVTYYAVFARENHNSKEYSFSLTPGDFSGASYSANEGEHTVTAEATATDDDSRMTVKYTVSNVMKQSGAIQFKASSGCLYNTTDLGEITSVTIGDGTNLNTYYGTSEHPTSGTNDGSNGFFTVKAGSSTGKASEITVVYSVGGGLTDFCTTITADDALFTVTFSTPYGTTAVKQNEVGEYVTPPSVESVGEYSYYGWSKTEKPIEDTVVPSCVTLTNGKYKPSMDITLYAMYKRTESYEGENHTYVISKDNNEIPTSYTDTSINVGGVNFVLTSVLRNANSYIQTGAGGCIYSEELPSVIKRITINYQYFTTVNRRNTLYVGDSEHPTSLKNYTYSDVDNVVTYEINGGYKYFSLVNEEVNANRITDITVECGSRDINFYTTQPRVADIYTNFAVRGGFPDNTTNDWELRNLNSIGVNKFSGVIDATLWADGVEFGFQFYNKEGDTENYWDNDSKYDFTTSNSYGFELAGHTGDMIWKHNDNYKSYYVFAEYKYNGTTSQFNWDISIKGIPAGMYLPGSWNNWDPSDENVMFANNTITLTLEENTEYEFKIFQPEADIKWYGCTGMIEQDTESPWVFHNSDITNCKLKTLCAGEYVFTLSYKDWEPCVSVEYPKEVLPVGSSNYATYYNSKFAYKMPADCEGYVAYYDDNDNWVFTPKYSGGDVVPADEALVIKAIDSGSKALVYAVTDNPTYASQNMNDLRGTDEKVQIPNNDNYYYYGFSYGHSGTANADKLGFYWRAENGAAFENGAHKAYLMVLKNRFESNPAKAGGFSIEDLTNGISNVNINTNEVLYNLNGQRINTPKRGQIYIMNGRKYIAK